MALRSEILIASEVSSMVWPCNQTVTRIVQCFRGNLLVQGKLAWAIRWQHDTLQTGAEPQLQPARTLWGVTGDTSRRFGALVVFVCTSVEIRMIVMAWNCSEAMWGQSVTLNYDWVTAFIRSCVPVSLLSSTRAVGNIRMAESAHSFHLVLSFWTTASINLVSWPWGKGFLLFFCNSVKCFLRKEEQQMAKWKKP